MADLKDVLDAVQKNKQALTDQIAIRVKELQERRKELKDLANTVAIKSGIEDLKVAVDAVNALVKPKRQSPKSKPEPEYKGNFESRDYKGNLESGV